MSRHRESGSLPTHRVTPPMRSRVVWHLTAGVQLTRTLAVLIKPTYLQNVSPPFWPSQIAKDSNIFKANVEAD